jgi:hypothetical protein
MVMNRISMALAALSTMAAPLLVSCAGPVSDAYVIENDPGHVEFIEGSDRGIVTLTEQAARRLEIQTTTVTTSPRGLVVPATAVFVDPEGDWWVYTAPEPNTFVRQGIKVKQNNGVRVLLWTGPRTGTEIVTVGVAELYGVETEIGH